ncbi:MAG: hypothetical protein QF687_06335 [Nitrospinaceae bacterium]|nr:hypothetical protein [Nitrospinaceae bacterium]
MKIKIQTAPAILFALLLMIPVSGFAHDDEHEAKGGHSSSEQYEEGSGMKTHSTKMYSEKHGEYKKQGKPSEYKDEGSDTKKHPVKSAKHQEEGSGSR